MGVAFLPTGRIVNNPDSVKLVHVIMSEVYGKVSYVVSVKLDDDSELLVESLSDEEEALKLSEACIEAINKAANDDFDDDDDDDDDDDIDDDDDDDDDDADDDDDDDDAGADAGDDDDDDDDWDDDSW
ncbi:MAG: hypothetical protein AAFV53_21305 [Myxococcota bacterium]